MERVLVGQATKLIGEEVKTSGFIEAIRDQGKIKFLMIRDISGIVQIVVMEKADLLKVASGLKLESVVEVVGVVKEEEQAPGGFEIQVNKIEILSTPIEELPIPVAEKGQEETNIQQRLDWRWLDLRKPEKALIFKVWTEMESAFREYWTKNGYIEIHSPKFMSTPSESGAELFEVKYFGQTAYLAQSPQFYKQMAMAAGFERVFITGPVFRAEPSYTTRHMTEFTGWDIEVSYIDSLEDVMAELENAFICGFEQVKMTLLPELNVPAKNFPKLTMHEAKERLKAAGVPSERPYDISAEEEIELCKMIKEETGSEFVFVTEWPIEVRPFYHMRQGKDLKFTRSADLLYKGLEIVTLAQREHRVEILEKQAEEKGMEVTSFASYINFFRYGCPPHGGAGIGPARIIMKMLDLPSVKEATFLPRDVKRLTP